MNKSIPLIGAMALLASLSGSEASAQHTMAGQAEKKAAVPKHPRFHTANHGSGVALGDQLLDQQQQGKRPDLVERTRAQPLPGVPGDNLAGDIVVDSPFAVYVGPSADDPVMILDGGLVPADGLRVLDMATSLPEGMDAFVRSGEVIVCFKDDDLAALEAVVLAGPGATALGNGEGASLIGLGKQSLDMSGEAQGSSDRGAAADGDDGRTREQELLDIRLRVAATRTAVEKQAAPGMQSMP